MAAAELRQQVRLRRFDLSDLDDFWVWASDEQVAANCAWDAFKNKDDLRRYMEEAVLPSPWFRAITVGGRTVGSVSVTLADSALGDRCRGELRYVVAREWWGKGVATAAARAATEAVFAEMKGLERVEALVDTRNEISMRVLEKVGYQREGLLRRYRRHKGLLRDMVAYSFTRADTLL